METIYQKIEHTRKPRVHIKYEVETEDSVVSKELPFVVGVLGNFSGESAENLKPLKDRKFISIEKDNFDDVMKKISPELNLKIKNCLQKDESELSVNLKFNAMEDFEPAKIVEQIPALKKLLDARNKLRDLLTKADRSENLEALLEAILQNTDNLKLLSHQLAENPS